MTAPFEHRSVTFARLRGADGARAAAMARSARHERTVAVRIDDAGIAIDGAHQFSRGDIESVSLGIGEGIAVLARLGDGTTASFRLADLADARAMLESLGCAFGNVRTTILISAPLELVDVRSPRVLAQVGIALALGIAVLVAAFVFFGVGGAVLPLGLGPFALMLSSSARVEVGADGLRVKWFAFQRFIPFSAVEGAAHDGGDRLTISLRNGERVTVQLAAADQIAAAAARIREGLDAASAAAEPDAVPAIRARVEGAAAVAELRRLGAARRDYRVAGLDREQLWALVEHPRTEPHVRANAAAALSGRLDEADRRRLRVAAAATTSDRVRVALEKAATGTSDDELAEALARLGAEID